MLHRNAIAPAANSQDECGPNKTKCGIFQPCYLATPSLRTTTSRDTPSHITGTPCSMRTIIEGFPKNQFANDASFFSSTFTTQGIPRDQSHYSVHPSLGTSVSPMTDVVTPRSANGIGLSRLRLFSSIILLSLSLRQRISFSVVPSLFFTCPRLAMLCKGE